MKSLLFHNCPDCNKPTFIKSGDEVGLGLMACEHCGKIFSVLDTKPFIMSTKISNQEVYAFQEQLPFPAL